MSWTRGLLAVLAVCVLLPAGSVGCGTSDAHEDGGGASTSPVGKVLDGTDQEGRHLREVGKKDAPEVGVEVQPDAGGTWDVRLSVHHFRFSAAGAERRAVAGRGYVRLYVDDRPVTRLRTAAYRLPARFVPRGTHHVTARLYADDGTAWGVKGEPVQSTADITASEPSPSDTARPGAASGTPKAAAGATDATGMSASGIDLRTGGRGSPDRVGKAS
ncbi:hypothetical protein ACIRJO_33500 [Streptomyces sp. NPDC102394]|uniref:hypothetical protein n=1 Tax=Streptomyces sp. NPDC102394 TaxID=3366167 RepID=UPI00381D7BE2